MARAIDGSELMLEIQACRWDSDQDRERAEDLVLGMPTLTPPNEWVSVEDRLPEPTYCVLVYTTDYSIEVDALDSDGEWMSFEVTHWMSLPAPPEKEKE